MSGERLIYLPLGGAGEIGMNAYVYGYGLPGKERLMLVDLGVAFPDMDTSPGVDLIVPDLSWLIDNLDRLDGIIITHAHEDHIGALGHLWPLLRKPVYARKFTASIVRDQLPNGSSIGSLGADAFVAVCSGMRPSEAERIIQQLKKRFSEATLETHGVKALVDVEITSMLLAGDQLRQTAISAVDQLLMLS